MANEMVVCTLEKAQVRVVSAVSKKGNEYEMFQCVLNGKVINLCFVTAEHELALLKAGYDLDK